MHIAEHFLCDNNHLVLNNTISVISITLERRVDGHGNVLRKRCRVYNTFSVMKITLYTLPC